MSYSAFLKSKNRRSKPVGFDVSDGFLSDSLYPFQQHIVKWAVRKGRAALFEDCGLGKTPQQLEWARAVNAETGKPVMIFAPLAVSQQTVREGVKFDVEVTPCRESSDVAPGINICNYEMLHAFDPSAFGGIVLDESSILKNYDGFYRKALTEFSNAIHFRLAATATPAPNDLQEIVNHSDFLSVLTGKEVMAMYFIKEGNTVHKWRLKGHAEDAFWAWMSEWSVALRKPSDLGFDDAGFDLPELRVIEHVVDGHTTTDLLFPVEAHTMAERRHARKESIEDRVNICADLVNNSDEQWLLWCNLNMESEMLNKAIPDARQVQGSDSPEYKVDAMTGFSDGRYRALVTKPSISGFGMNWQHCSHMAFVGLSDSWEQYYQAVRRCWRFGQTRPVEAHIIISECEGAVVANIQRKERNASDMYSKIVAKMQERSHALD